MNSLNIAGLKSEVIELFEMALADHGQNKRVGTIYANLIASPDPFTQDQLAKQLQISNSTVSRALTSLEDRFRLIKSKRLAGTKKAEYTTVEGSFDKLLTIGIMEVLEQYRNFASLIRLMRNKYQGILNRSKEEEELKFYSDLLENLETSLKYHIVKLTDVVNSLQ